MGLYGLVGFLIEIKQAIGENFGTSTKWILIWMSKEYIILIFISFLIALPASFWVAQQWLNNFHYNIDIDVGHSLIIILLISATTVGYKS